MVGENRYSLSSAQNYLVRAAAAASRFPASSRQGFDIRVLTDKTWLSAAHLRNLIQEVEGHIAFGYDTALARRLNQLDETGTLASGFSVSSYRLFSAAFSFS